MRGNFDPENVQKQEHTPPVHSRPGCRIRVRGQIVLREWENSWGEVLTAVLSPLTTEPEKSEREEREKRVIYGGGKMRNGPIRPSERAKTSE